MSKHLSASYSKSGDQLKVYWDDAPSSADELDDRQHITVLRDLKDEKLIVGCKIWGLSEILDRAGLKLVPKDDSPPVCPKHKRALHPDGSCDSCISSDLLD